MRFAEKGGSAVRAGTYWNFETGEKVRLEQAGRLPGKSRQIFYKLPPLLILALTAAAGHVALYVLPTYLVQLYKAYTEQLVRAYIVFDYLAIGVLLSGLATALSEVFGVKLQLPAFNWNPAEAHLAGKRAEEPVSVRIDDDTEK